MLHFLVSLFLNFKLFNMIFEFCSPHLQKCCTRYLATTYFGKNFKHCWSHSLAHSNSFVVGVVLNQDLLQSMYRMYSCRNSITSCIWTFFCMQSPKCDSHSGTYLQKMTVNGAGSIPYCKHTTVIFIYILRPVNNSIHSTFLCKNVKIKIFFQNSDKITGQALQTASHKTNKIKSFSECTIIPVHQHRMLWTLIKCKHNVFQNKLDIFERGQSISSY